MTTLAQLINAFARVRDACEGLAITIVEKDAALPAWVPGESPDTDLIDGSARAFVAQHCQALSQSSKINIGQGGLVASSPRTVAAIAKLNRAKGDFKERVLALRSISAGQRLATLLRSLASDAQRDDDVAQALRQAGMAGLNLRYCYRTFKVLPEDIHAVSWVWIYSTSAIQQITAADAIDLVLRALPEGDLQELSLRVLSGLAPDTPLAVKRPVAKNLRANIWVGEDRPRPIVAHSPLFYPVAAGMPRRRWDYDPKQRPRMQRHDRKICDAPLIQALHLYEYLPDRTSVRRGRKRK